MYSLIHFGQAGNHLEKHNERRKRLSLYQKWIQTYIYCQEQLQSGGTSKWQCSVPHLEDAAGHAEAVKLWSWELQPQPGLFNALVDMIQAKVCLWFISWGPGSTDSRQHGLLCVQFGLVLPKFQTSRACKQPMPDTLILDFAFHRAPNV